MTFNDFLHEYSLKNKAISNIKFHGVLSTLGLSDVGIYLRDGPFSSDMAIVDLHPSKGTHWVCYINQKKFDRYGCAPPQKLSEFIVKRNGHCLFSEYKKQGLTNKRDNFCASFCLDIVYLRKVDGIDFKSAVLYMYCQGFS